MKPQLFANDKIFLRKSTMFIRTKVINDIFKSIVAISVASMLFSCRQNKLEDVNALSTKKNIPVIAAKEVKVLYSEEAAIKVKVESPVMNQYIDGEERYIEMPEGVTVLFYDSTDKVSSRLKANYAIDYETQNRMEAKNDVVVVNEKNEQLNTEHLIWDKKEQKIFSDVFVKISRPDKVFFGEGMESDERFENWKLKKVKGTFSVDADKSSDSTNSK